MTKNSLLLVLICTLFIFSSGCKKSEKSEQPLPVADFSYTGANAPAPATVIFTNLSSNSTSYLWEFGDSTISFEKDPSHFYQTGAAYIVKLTANGGLGTNSMTKTVSFTNIPTQCKIISLSVKNIPFLDHDGRGWDAGNGPDVFFKISNGTSLLFNATDSRFYDITYDSLPLTWFFPTPFAILPINSLRFITIYDYDSDDPDDYVGTVTFTPSLFFSYPVNVTLGDQWGLSITLYLQWQYP